MALGLACKFRHDAGGSKKDAAPSHGGEGMSLEEDTEKDAKDFTCGGDSTQNQRVKVGNGIKDKTLPDCRTERKLENHGKYLRIGRNVGHAGGEFTETEGNDKSGKSHKKIRPKHEIVGFGLYAGSLGGSFESFLKSCRDAVQYERKDDKDDSHGRRRSRASLLFAHTDYGRSTDNGQHLQIFANGVTCPPQQQRAGHDGSHFARFGEGGDRKTEPVG